MLTAYEKVAMKYSTNFITKLCGCILMLTSFYASADAVSIKKSAQGVPYITGGISADEVDAMRPYIAQFNLRVIFSEGASGRSITDVNVNLYDTEGKLVFRLVGAQPQLLLDIPAGTYTILASYNGDKQRHKFTIGSNEHKKIILNWKNLVDEDVADTVDAAE